MALTSLLYASTARPDLTPSDLENIVATATRVNAELEVTGMLAYNGKGFAQILEGEVTTVETLMDRITADPRHSGCVVLSQKPIDERRFAGWSMAYRELSDLIMIQDVVA